MAFQKLSGTIRLENDGQFKNLSGLQLEVFTLNTQTQGAGVWLGSSFVDPSGEYQIYSGSAFPASVFYYIYRGQSLIKSSAAQVANQVMNIGISRQEYDAAVPDDTKTDFDLNYILFEGSVILDGGEVMGAPAGQQDLYVDLKLCKFRQAESIGATRPDEFGRFRLKIPQRYLYPNAQFEYNRFPQVRLDVIGGQDIIGQSEKIRMSQNHIETSIRVSDQSYFRYFSTEFESVSGIVSRITGIDPLDFYTIISEEDHEDMNAVLTLSGLDSRYIYHIIEASALNRTIPLGLRYLYALARKGYNTEGAILGIEDTVFRAIIEEANDQHIIDEAFDDNKYLIIGTSRVDTELQDTNDDNVTLADVLYEMVGEQAAVDSFMKLYDKYKYDGNTLKLWDDAGQEIGAAATEKLQNGFQILSVVGLQKEMISRLTQEAVQVPFPDFIASARPADILQKIQAVCEEHKKLCVPRSVRGDVPVDDYSNQQVQHDYAQKIYDSGQKLFVSKVIQVRLSDDQQFRSQFADPSAVSQFLTQNVDYDFRVGNVWDENLNISAALRKDLIPLQNIVRLTSGHPGLTTALISTGIKSAVQMAGLSPSELKNIIDISKGGEAEVEHAFKKAKQIEFHVKNSYLQVFPGNYVENVTLNVNPGIWSKDQQQAGNFPDLESLFGNMDFCTCSDCSSMYSPGAYFTDLFNFIKSRLGGLTAYTELIRRRPDLPHIDISCKNANTPLPYIDLVNELLELVILRDIRAEDPDESSLFVPPSFQTQSSPAGLEAYPEHIYKHTDGMYRDYRDYVKVYDKRLSKAVYPNVLPFNLAVEESRYFLRHLDRPRYDMMESFRPADFTHESGYEKINEYTLAAEWFGITREVADIITRRPDDALPDDLWIYYGFDSEGTWYDTLCEDLPTLLKRAGIAYSDLLRLLITDFLNPVSPSSGERPFAIASKPGKPVDSCKLDELMLEYRPAEDEDITEAKIHFFSLLHRFIRLYRATGWTIYQTDIVLRSFEASDIDENTFLKVYRTSRLVKEHSILPEHIVCLWSDISTTRYIDYNSAGQSLLPSVYDTLFRNKLVINPPDINFEDPLSIDGSMEDNKATIMAAFGLSEYDIRTLLGSDMTSMPTTLILLSQIYTSSLLLSCTGIRTISELQEHIRILGMDYYTSGTPELRMNNCISVIRQIQRQRQTAFSIQDMKYIFLHQDTADTFIVPDRIISRELEDIRSELAKSLNHFDLSLDPVEHPEAEVIKERLRKILYQNIAALFGLDFRTSEFLLSGAFQIGTAPDYVSEVLISNEFILSTAEISRDNSISTLDFSDLYDLYARVLKASMIISRLRLSADLAIHLQKHCDELYVTDYTVLPAMPVHEGTAEDISRFFNLNDWIRFRDIRGWKDEFLVRLTRTAIDTAEIDNQAWKGILADQAGWAAYDLDVLLGATGMGSDTGILRLTYAPADPENNDYRIAGWLLRISEIMSSCISTGLDAQTLYNCLLPDIDSTLSILLRKTARARHSESEWPAVIKPVQDGLRVRQRDALTAYILADPGIIPDNNMKIEHENDLFAYLLIDVEMESCMKTSRLKQAISSLQLYLDRIILNIERVNSTGALIAISDTLTAQWQSWRKWYRVWEANRKVFLYPENWIEPELRDDKSPEFRMLEDHLLQGEPTDAYVTQGFRQYLSGLSDISRLDPVCAYHEKEADRDILHVVGRTNTEPHLYYYRKYTDNEWTNWERIDIDIKGDHIIPFIFDNKFHISWISFTARKNQFPTPAPGFRQADGMLWIDAVSNSPGGLQSFRAAGNNDDGRDMTLEGFVNWTFLEDGKWQKQQSGTDIMQMEIGRHMINSVQEATYGTAESDEAFKIFTKGGDIPPADFFRNRIYIISPLYTYNKAGGILFSMLFAGSWDEFGRGMHSFSWKGDGSREPEVVKYTEYSPSIAAPFGTRINKMKFEQDRYLGPQLRKDTTFEKIWKSGYYTFSLNYYIDWMHYFRRKGAPLTILSDTPFGRFRLTGMAADKTYSFSEMRMKMTEDRFFFEDEKHTFYAEKISTLSIPSRHTVNLVKTREINISDAMLKAFETYPFVHDKDILSSTQQVSGLISAPITQSLSAQNYRFHTFYHAQINKFMTALNRDGVNGLMQLRNQSQADTMNFRTQYKPTSLVNALYPGDHVQFGFSEPYSRYNWELFFHAPMMIAQRLKDNLQFEEAQKWYHFIFDPTSNTNINGAIVTTNQRFWKFYPFYEQSGTPAQTLHQLLSAIHSNNAEAVAQVKKWENNPFNPHIIARMRILAYMKNVLMKYLDNLIAWGDHLYKRDTIESINEATQLYILASNILGEKPREIPPRVKRKDYTFDELSAFGLDSFSNALVEIESFYAPNDAPAGTDIYHSGGNAPEDKQQPVETVPLHTFYFCLPPNDKLLGYWKTIEDRLFKVRNCMTLEGVVRQLPLYEPPIDPALLVRAAAAGIDVNTVLDQVYGVDRPLYRFVHMVQKANELISDVKVLGSALLSALEKKDGELLAQLRSTQEISLLQRIRQVRIRQVSEAQAALEALLRTRENTAIRLNYYSTRTDLNAQEQTQLTRLEQAKVYQVTQGVLETVAGTLSAIPTFHVQALASGFSHGGLQTANVCRAASAAVGIKTAIENFKAVKAGIMGGYGRRRDDWNLQRDTAAKEIQQLDAQILAAEIRLDIAVKELENHDLQTENAIQADTFMRSKFSNADLYNWMLSQLSVTYFQTYQLAYDTARKAEQCYLYELPMRSYPAEGFVTSGYWDSLKKGLLSGEKLQLDVRRMEAAYMEENARELELSKNISIALYAPEALLELKRTGRCTVHIPEELYDLDYTGHYMRRIKSVSLSVPCVAGPYTTISCQLHQDSSRYRKESTVMGSGYTDPLNYTEVHGHTMVAASTGQNDSGLFELNFRDERYLPFEGTGAISTWSLAFPDDYRQFDYDSITDVILHIRYTARYDGRLATDAGNNLKAVFASLGADNILYRFYSLRHEFSNEWFRYLNAAEHEEPGNAYRLTLKKDQFPFFTKGRKIEITGWLIQMNPGVTGMAAVINSPALGISSLIIEENKLSVVELPEHAVITVTEEGLPYDIDFTLTCDNHLQDLEDIYWTAVYRITDEEDEDFTLCPRTLSVKDFTGNPVTGFPAGVFDINGRYIGVAASKEQFSELWNNAPAHNGLAKIFPSGTDAFFTILGDPEETITELRAMYALQFDIEGTDTLDSFSAPENAYIDYGDGTVIFVQNGGELPDNTLFYKAMAPGVPMPLNVCVSAYHDQTFTIANYCINYVHLYEDTQRRTVSIMFNLDSDYVMDMDNKESTKLLDDHVYNLRGYLPLGTRSIDYSNTRNVSFNTLKNIKNLDDVQPNLLRFRLRTGDANACIEEIDFGTWDFPHVKCLDFGTFGWFATNRWDEYSPLLVRDIIGTTDLPAKYPELHTIGMIGKRYSADLNLAIPNIRMGLFGIHNYRFPDGTSDLILQQLDSVKTDTGGTLIFYTAGPQTPDGIAALTSLRAKGMTITFPSSN